MSAAGLAAAFPERRKKQVDWKWIAAVALQFALLAYGYGRLNQRVDSLHEDVQLIRQDVRDLLKEGRERK